MYELTPRKEKKRARERGGRESERGRDKIFAGKGMKYDFICRWGAGAILDGVGNPTVRSAVLSSTLPDYGIMNKLATFR